MASALTRAGILGDIHAEDVRLDAALRLFAAQGTDAVLSVGDIADGAGSLDRACDLLASAGAIAVRGNHDRWIVEGTLRGLDHAHRLDSLSPSTRAFLEALPPTRRLETCAGPLLLCHGVGDNDMRKLGPDDEGYELACNEELHALLRQPELRFAAGGHTHRRMVRRFDHLTFFNAGTLLREREPCVLVVDFEARRASFFPMTDERSFGPAQDVKF